MVCIYIYIYKKGLGKVRVFCFFSWFWIVMVYIWSIWLKGIKTIFEHENQMENGIINNTID